MRAHPSSAQRLALLTRLAPWLTGAAFFVFYTASAAPSLVALFDDSLEFQLVLPTFAIAHPTGYPLYTLLGGIWSRVIFPFGNWAWRVNVFSALAAGAAIGFVFALAQRLVNGSSLPVGRGAVAAPAHDRWKELAGGLAAALTFGLGPVWSAQATLAEVYALHNLLLAAMLLVTLAVPACKGRRLDVQMALLALLFGLGLTHHRTIVLALPGVAVYLLWSVQGLWRPRRTWLLWLLALSAPLLLYLYLPLRASAGAVDLHGSYAHTWQGFWDHVLARGYTGFFTVSVLSVERTPAQWADLVLAQVGWLGLLLAATGAAWAFLPAKGAAGTGAVYWSESRKGWLLVLLVLVVNLVFALLYRVGDQEVFLLPVFLCLALLAGGGVAAVGEALVAARPAPGGTGYAEKRTPHLVAGLILALLVLLLWNPGRGPFANRSEDWAAHDYAVDIATVPFPSGSTVIGLEGEVTALKYMQAAEGLGTTATPIAADAPERRREVLAAAVASGAPAYLTRELEGSARAGADAPYSFSGEGPLVRVWPRGTTQAGTPQYPLAVLMDEGRLQLTGYDLQRLEWAGGPTLRVNLYWQPATDLPRLLKVSLRLIGPDGNSLIYPNGTPAILDQFPVRQVAPTTTWLPGETLRDVYTLPLPPTAHTEPAILQVILYDAESVVEVGRWETPINDHLSR